MCGRFSRDTSWEEVHAFSRGLLDLVVPAEAIEASFNVAPTQSSWVLVAEEAGAAARKMRWGLVPSWAKDIKSGASMINARLETASTLPSFRSAWKARRCVVPASGYYEWKAEGGIKQPYWIHDSDGPLLMFAGLWENWKSPEGEWLQSFAILTGAARGPMLELHERAPLMLGARVLRDWLHGGSDDAAAIAWNPEPPALAWHPVSRAVGNPRSNGPQLIERI